MCPPAGQGRPCSKQDAPVVVAPACWGMLLGSSDTLSRLDKSRMRIAGPWLRELIAPRRMQRWDDRQWHQDETLNV